MIHHTVFFRLRHPSGSDAERDFMRAARGLATIPGVENFESLRQVGAKNAFTLGLSMTFADRRTYDAYDAHPDHERFVRERWAAEVEEFMEIDYVAYEEAGA